MSNTRQQFTCYFCNQLIVDESEIGHTTMCSKVLVPCPFKCGSYIERAYLVRHKMECNNNQRKSGSFDTSTAHRPLKKELNTSSLDRNGLHHQKLKQPEGIEALQRAIAELEARLSTALHQNKQYNFPSPHASSVNHNLDEIKATLKQQSVAIQKANYFNGFVSEWKKNVDSQIATLRSSLASLETHTKAIENQWNSVQEKLAKQQNLQVDLNVLKESVYKETTYFKKTEMDFARNIEELRSLLNEQNSTFHNMWMQHATVLDNVITDLQSTKQALDEQKVKLAGLTFDLRAVSQISSEAAEKIEIQEREFTSMRQEVNQMKIDLEILESLASSGDSDTGCFKRLIWRITDFESKMKRAKENDVVFKSPIFYSEKYGYKIRLLLYLNGLRKWKDRYALACLHVLKGEYDPLLMWPCIIEGNVILRDQGNSNQPKNFSKYIKAKRSHGDEEEDEPQESTSTYIFIPHNTLYKENYLKNDVVYLDININSQNKYETSL